MMYNENVALVLEEMGFGSAGRVVHVSAWSEYPRDVFDKLTEYRSSEIERGHIKMPRDTILCHWSGPHMDGGKAQADAVRARCAYASFIDASKPKIWAKYACVFLAYLAQNSLRLKRGGYFAASKWLRERGSIEQAVPYLWSLYQACFNAQDLDMPTEESAEDLYWRFGLVDLSNLSPTVAGLVKQYPDNADGILMLYRRGLSFEDMETIQANDMGDANELREVLDRLTRAGVLADYDEEYSQDDPNKPLFTVMSEGKVVDNDKSGGIIETSKGETPMAVIIHSSSKGIGAVAREVGDFVIESVGTYVGIMVKEGGEYRSVADLEADVNWKARDMASKIAAAVDAGKAINEAIEPYKALVCG